MALAAAQRRTLWVDRQNVGNTGRRGDPDNPFPSITAALAVVESGDLIDVAPGRYYETNLLRSGKDYKIYGPMADVYGLDPAQGGIIDDSSEGGAGGACTVDIHLRDIVRAVSPPYIGARKYPCVRIANANSVILLTCRRIENLTYKATQLDGTTLDPCCILASAGRGLIRVDDYIRSRFYDALLSYVGANGDITTYADEIIGGYYAELGDPDNVHGYYADGAAALVETETLNAGEGGEFGGTGAIWRVYARRWGSNNSFGFSMGNSIVHAKIMEDIFGANEAFKTTANGGLCHVRARELRSTNEPAAVIGHTGTFWFYGTNFYTEGTTKAAATVAAGATLNLKQGCGLKATGANSITGAGTVNGLNGTEANVATTGVTVNGAVTAVAALV